MIICEKQIKALLESQSRAKQSGERNYTGKSMNFGRTFHAC
jgi:hypothetical protein